MKFRWLYYSDTLGEETWSQWHVKSPTCPSCCCRKGNDPEHCEPNEYEDEDGILTKGHTYFDPSDPDAKWERRN